MGKELHSRQATVFRHLFGHLVGLLPHDLDFSPQLRQLARSVLRRRALAFCLNQSIGEALVFRDQFGQSIVLPLGYGIVFTEFGLITTLYQHRRDDCNGDDTQENKFGFFHGRLRDTNPVIGAAAAQA